mmetsp:Transcript_14685/g.21460  ORF Transcript_14685/g.21460 Transcript_14685/m.21460 type:complete len:206 (-) Transcript_14685:1728-2345(-)
MVRRDGFVVMSILAMQCRALRRVFLSESVGFSFSSTLSNADKQPCCTIVPLTLSSSAMRFIAITNCSIVCSLVVPPPPLTLPPPFSISFTIARGTLQLAILRIRSFTASNESSITDFVLDSNSFSSSVLPRFCNSSYCSAVISFPSNASLRSVSAETARRENIVARPYDAAKDGEDVHDNSTSRSNAVCDDVAFGAFKIEEDLKP